MSKLSDAVTKAAIRTTGKQGCLSYGTTYVQVYSYKYNDKHKLRIMYAEILQTS